MDVRHAIDVMHVEKNVCESLMGLLLNIPGKTKDTLKARRDLADMNIRPELHPLEQPNGRQYLPPTCYTLSAAEKISLLECLQGVRVPSGYSANIKRLVNMKEKKLVGMKSHDCHVLRTQLLPVAIRGILPDKVRNPIIKLCSFFNAIYQKVIDPSTLDKLQADVIITLCQLEMCFPLSFFDILVHLVSHIVKEIKILGPVYLHNMWAFERFMGIIKKYVRNRARPEGSIVEGYAIEEVVEFCIDYMDLHPIGVPMSRHEGRLLGKGTLGHKAIFAPSLETLRQAHFAVLQQSTLVAPFVDMHYNKLRSENPSKSEAWIAKQHRLNFGDWLQKHIIAMNTDSDQLYVLSRGPASTIHSFQGYDINGYTFYTRTQDAKSSYQNSGVHIDAFDSNGVEQTYHGYIEAIWELEYGPLKVPLFQCQWVKIPSGLRIDKYGMFIVDLNNVGYQDEPFVLAESVTQVFYVKDPSSLTDRHVVLHGKRSIVGVENIVDEEGYDQIDELPPFATDVEGGEESQEDEDEEEAPYVRSDHEEGVIVIDLHV